MAATNYTPIQLYYSTTASAAPAAGNLVNGELAINITDGKLYYKDNGGNVQVIATKGAGTIGGSNTQIQFNDGGALAGNAAMVFNKSTNVTTLTTLNLTNALGATYGGTAQSAYAQGDLLYASAVNTLSKLTIGTVNYILTSTGSVPQWVAPSSVTVQTANNLAGGAGGSVPYQSAADTTTFLAIGAANRVMTSSGSAPQWVTSLTGLTGVSSSSMTNTSLTSGRLVYSTTGGAQTDSANLTFNGTTLSMTGLSNTGFSTIVKTVTLGDSNFNGAAVFAPATPAKLYIGTGTVTDVTSAASATNTTGAITAFGITPIAATNTSVTYTNASTLYIAGAPTAGTNVTITNPYAFYVAGGAAYFGGAVTYAGGQTFNGNVTVGASSANTLTINSTITSNLLFTDNTYDIGASGATRPRNLYLAGSATIGTGSSSAIITLNANTAGGSTPQIYFQAAGTNKWALGGGNIGAGGANDFSVYNYNTTANALIIYSANSEARFGGNLTFISDNAYDIGASAANRPRNIFLAGYMSGGYVTNSNSSNVMGGLTIQGGGLSSAGINTFNRAAIVPLDLSPSDDSTVTWRIGTTSVAQGGGAFDIQTSGTGSVNGQIAAISRTTGKATWYYDSIINGLTVGRGSGSVSTNTVLGSGALASGSPGGNIIAIGYQAGDTITGGATIAIGRQTARAVSGSYNTFVGDQAGYNATSVFRSTFIGAACGYGNHTGAYNIGVGGYDSSGNATFESALSGFRNHAFGAAAWRGLTSGVDNIAIGYQTGFQASTANRAVLIGCSAGYYGDRSGDIAIGYQAGLGASTYSGSTNICIGENSGAGLTSGYGNIFIGYYSGQSMTTGAYNVILGRYSGNNGTLNMAGAAYYVAVSDGAANLKAWWSDSANFYNQASIFLRGSTSYTSGGAINYTGNWVDGGSLSAVAEWRLSRYNTNDYRWLLSGSGVNGEVMILSSYSAWQASNTAQQSFQFGGFSGGYFCPGTDNITSLGTSVNRWTTVYATTGTINTSDRNQKQDIQDLSAAELAVAKEIKTLFKSFRWKDAVAEKGDDARIHVGVIAQDVQDAFAKHGLDAARYALWCEDVHYELDGKYADKIGVKYTAETEGAVRVTKLGVRYDQLLGFVIAAM